jgi:hypothetical protein
MTKHLTKYQATAPDGTVFRRTTKSRKHSHCVVRQLQAGGWQRPEWRRTRELAEALAQTYRNRGQVILVLEAVEA